MSRRRVVELEGFKSFVTQAAEMYGGMKELGEKVGLHFTGIYRRFRALPWIRWGKEGEFLKRLAEVLVTPFERVLWLAGYNPFVKREYGLTPKALDALWELNLKIAEAVKQGRFRAEDITKLAALALKDIEEEAQSNATRGEAGTDTGNRPWHEKLRGDTAGSGTEQREECSAQEIGAEKETW